MEFELVGRTEHYIHMHDIDIDNRIKRVLGQNLVSEQCCRLRV